MVFSSLLFIFIFLPVTLMVYFIFPRKFRNLIILIASLIFYGWGEPIYIAIMIFSTCFDFLNAILIDKFRGKKKLSFYIMFFSITVNLGILGFFKYYNFLIDILNTKFSFNIKISTLPLPIGISFYTFQTMSYVIDVYLKKVKVQRNIINFGAYIAMFPQLVAGPIVKYDEVEKDINDRKITISDFSYGVERFIEGLGKKILLANNLGFLWVSIKNLEPNELSVMTAWIGIIAFTLQIYYDFSGYSDMAIAMGKMLGFTFPENFNYPYISTSITEFWKRWHITLGSWFREYLYIPLGGNREGKIKLYRNLIIVWLLTGLWHGANLNFIVWGGYYGVIIIAERMILKRYIKKAPKVIGHIYTMTLIIIGWVFFEYESLEKAVAYIKKLFGFSKVEAYNALDIYYLSSYGIIIIIAIIMATPTLKIKFDKFKYSYSWVSIITVPVIYFFIMFLSIAYLVNSTYNPFLYFRF